MYNFDDVMNKLDDLEEKIDILLEKSYKYDYFSTYSHVINGTTYRAEVCRRNDGVWCVEKFRNDNLIGMKSMGIHNQSYAEDAAENYVFQVGV